MLNLLFILLDMRDGFEKAKKSWAVGRVEAMSGGAGEYKGERGRTPSQDLLIYSKLYNIILRI